MNLTETQFKLLDLKKRAKKAQNYIDVSQNKSLDTNFEVLVDDLDSISPRIEILQQLMASFIDDSEEIPRQMDEFVLNISEINNGLIKVLESTAWNEIFDIEIRSYEFLSPQVNSRQYFAFKHYLEFGKDFDLSDELFGEIEEKIMDSVKFLFANGTFHQPRSTGHYSAIIGPSFMGKTQFSFILANKHPVIYLNLVPQPWAQEIYTCFGCFGRELNTVLWLDYVTLKETQNSFKAKLESNERVSGQQKHCCDLPIISSTFFFFNPDLKLKVIGFLWNLVEYSTTFDFNNSTDEAWFSHYLKDRIINYETMSLKMFWDKMKRLVDNTPSFRIPIVFIDELSHSGSTVYVELLRNIVCCLVLPCVISSTNSSMSYIPLYLTSGSSLSDSNQVSVYGICKIMKANLIPIFNRLEVTPGKFLKQFTSDDRLLLDPEILADLEITCDDENKKNLFKIWEFMLQQSLTCLQGTCYYAFYFFIEILTSFKGQRLDSAEFWSKLCLEIAYKLKWHKPTAFQMVGQQLSCLMFSTSANLFADEYDEDGSQFIHDSINSHFYYFGEEDGPDSLPFNIQGEDRIIDGTPYKIRSHFKTFEKDVFTNMALWYGTVRYEETIASVAKEYVNKHDKYSNSNIRSKQETMCYWAVAYASHQNFKGKTLGTDFFYNFVKNVQIPPVRNVINITLNASRIPSKLQAFLNDITVPYLMPDNPTKDFKSLLAGLCDLGACYRNEMGILFEIENIKNSNRYNAYVEFEQCSQGQVKMSKYISKAKKNNSILSLVVIRTFDENSNIESADDCDKVETSCEDDVINEFQINIYYVFYDQYNGLYVKALLEVDAPDGVFIIVESNY